MEDRWNDAVSSFSNDKLKELAVKGKNLPYKSANTAMLFSVIIPGTGEFYSHRWFNGLLIFSLNAVIGGWAIKSFTDKRWVDGTLITSLLWNRFYLGGIENARKSAVKYNKQLKEDYLNGLEDYKLKLGFQSFPTTNN